MKKAVLKTQYSSTQLLHSYRTIIAVWALVVVLLGLCAVLAFPATSEAAVIRRAPNNLGLVGYWSFDDARGSTATDFSGSSNDGTLTNMDPGSDWVSGKLGTALRFDGGDDHVDIGERDEKLSQNAWTVAAWVKPSKLEDWNNIVGAAQPNGSYLRPGGYISIDASGNLRDYDGSWLISNGTIPKDKWSFVVFQYESNNTYKMYINGELDTTFNDVNSANHANGVFYMKHIGKFGAGVGRYFDGKIDEVRVYDRALSSSEVKDLYNAGGYAKRNATADSLFPDKLVSHWTMDGPDISGSTVKDVHGSNDGTKNGDPIAREGQLGQALKLDGDDDFIKVSDSNSLSFSDQITVSMWVYPLSYSTQDFVDDTFVGTWGLNENRLLFRRDKGNNRTEFWLNGLSDRQVVTQSGVRPPEDEWTHLAATYDGSKMQIYFNAKQKASTVSGGAINDSTDPVFIGSENGKNHFFHGISDDVRIYDKSLSAEQISRLYTATKPDTINFSQNSKLTDGLVGMWSFDGQDLSSTTAADVSDNDNDGTLKKGPQTTIGRIGQALEFDGVDDYVQADSKTETLNDVTVSAWVKYTGGGNFQDIISRAWGNSGSQRTWELQARSGSGVRFNAYIDDIDYTTNFINWTVDEWVHVVGVRSQDGDLRIYTNGTRKDSQTMPSGALDDDANAGLRIGRLESGNATFNGKIDNVRVYDRALNKSEVERLYNLGR